ncbi:hypothetical protein BDR26DRAFT_854046, partial [Obelidium mucronatum]
SQMDQDIWYSFINESGNPAIEGVGADTVSFRTDKKVLITHLRTAVWEKNQRIIEGVAAQLKVFLNKDDITDSAKELTAGTSVGGDHVTEETALFVVVPKKTSATTSAALSSSANTQTPKVIAIYSSQQDALVISVPTREQGRPWHRILLFLQTLCGNFDMSKYSLKAKATMELVDLSHDSIMILPGDYVTHPNGSESEDLKAQGYAFPIVPTYSRLKRKTTGSPLNSSPSPTKKTAVSSPDDEDNESVITEVTEANNQGSTFREKILTRDNHCVVTRDYSVVKAAYILSHSWWLNSNQQKPPLPVEIRNVIASLDEGINNISNGILLRADLADAFDDGKFSFVFRNGHFYFVAITTDFLALDGIQVDENLRPRSDGTCWWSNENQPHSQLVEFHLRNSVFRYMKGSALTEEDSDSELEG